MFTQDEMLQEIQRVAIGLGKKSLSIAEFNKHGKISVATVLNRFGSWDLALQAAGLEPIDPIQRACNTDSIDELLLDQSLRYTEIDRNKMPTRNLKRVYQLDANLINATQKLEAINQLERWFKKYRRVIFLEMSRTAYNEACVGSKFRRKKADVSGIAKGTETGIVGSFVSQDRV